MSLDLEVTDRNSWMVTSYVIYLRPDKVVVVPSHVRYLVFESQEPRQLCFRVFNGEMFVCRREPLMDAVLWDDGFWRAYLPTKQRDNGAVGFIQEWIREAEYGKRAFIHSDGEGL